jgi:hypothetical protein
MYETIQLVQAAALVCILFAVGSIASSLSVMAMTARRREMQRALRETERREAMERIKDLQDQEMAKQFTFRRR